MIKRLIQNYIKKLKKEDIQKFAQKEGYTLLDSETSYIYETIKKDSDILLNGDTTSLFQELKTHVRPEVYEHIVSLFQHYRSFL